MCQIAVKIGCIRNFFILYCYLVKLIYIKIIILLGRRIEVRIITAGYYDNEDGKDFEFLTDEETDQFQNMIMALLVCCLIFLIGLQYTIKYIVYFLVQHCLTFMLLWITDFCFYIYLIMFYYLLYIFHHKLNLVNKTKFKNLLSLIRFIIINKIIHLLKYSKKCF